MRIAHVSAAMQYGGAERVLVDLATGSARAGLEVAIVAPPGMLDRDWDATGIDRLLIPVAERDPLDLARAARAVRGALRSWQPDVIHAHNVKATALALTGLRAARLRLPVLSTLHGVAPRQMWAAAKILRFADAVAAVSEEVCQAAIAGGLGADRIEVVPNGVDEIPPLSAAARIAYDREFALHGQVVAAVGRLVPVKAHERFLEAAAIVLESRPETTFLIIGDGPEGPALRQTAAKLGISGAVRFAGARADARLLIDRADLLVFSSDREGHSIAALEALAAGTPVVSTDVAGMRQLLGSGAGMIVVGAQPGELAAAIVELLDDEPRSALMGQTGRRLIAEQLSVGVMLNRYAGLYARLVR
jgi:glycosyltransferase involved in cell wall biosynthesis